MKRTARIFVVVLSIAATSAFGKSQPYNFQLKQTLAGCDGSPTFATFYSDITWNPSPGSRRFNIGTGNKCEINGKVCGLSSAVCTFTCPGTGPCKVRLQHCQISRGSYRLSIVDVSNARYQYPPVKTQAPAGLCRPTK